MCLFVIQETKLKDLEEELKVLGEGLSTIEEVRDWLFTRITAIQEEKLYVKSVDRYSSQDVSTAFCITPILTFFLSTTENLANQNAHPQNQRVLRVLFSCFVIKKN